MIDEERYEVTRQDNRWVLTTKRYLGGSLVDSSTYYWLNFTWVLVERVNERD